MPVTLDYNRYRKPDLATFAVQRGLNVTSTSLSGRRRPLRLKYITALQEADANTSFRFLDLPPELRNWVYRELLVLHEQPACYPQILAASKQTHAEASGILYGHNTINITVDVDGVSVRGRLCGDYVPFVDPADYEAWRRKDAQKIAWPEYLRRVDHIHLSVVKLQLPAAMARQPPKLRTFDNILYSLCSFLGNNCKIRLLHVDLSWITGHIELDPLDDLTETLYPVRLLRTLKAVNIDRIDPAVSEVVLAATFGKDRGSRGPSTVTEAARQINNCHSIIAGLLFQDVTGPRLRPFLENLFSYSLSVVSVADELLKGGIFFQTSWERKVIRQIRTLRSVLDHHADIGRTETAFRDPIFECLRMEINMRTSGPVDVMDMEP